VSAARTSLMRVCAVVCAAIVTAAVLLLVVKGVVVWAGLPCAGALVSAVWYPPRGSGS
jgi:hypothetical protein